MPIARVQLPDGRIARYEVPEGTTPEQAQSIAQSHFAAMNQSDDSDLPEPLRPRKAVAEKPVQEQTTWEKIRPYVAPAAQALGAGGGALIGGAGGSIVPGAGTVAGGAAGAGLGYGIAQEALNLADIYLGHKAPRQGIQNIIEPAMNVLEGATMELGGMALSRIISRAIGVAYPHLMTMVSPQAKAAKIANNALGPDLPEALNALKASQGQGITAAQATADINSPTWQALAERALSRDPRFTMGLKAAQDQESLNALTNLAGGKTAADVLSSVKAAKEAVRDTTTPMREAALERANLGKEVARLEGLSSELGSQAAAKVQQVRDLINAGNVAQARSELDAVKKGLPSGLSKYTYSGELAEKAFNEWSDKAASASLDLGQGAKFAQDAADNLRAQGIKPLQSQPLVNALSNMATKPEFAGNDIISGALQNVTKDISKWTESGGVIDARALDAIRKNSVNAAIQQMRPGLDATSQKNLAAGVLSNVKPVIDDAIEQAGGFGYREYLNQHAKLSQQVAEKQLTGEALNLWKNNKDAFVRLVQNEAPDTVEKILGPGKYDIGVNLANDTLGTLQSEASKVIRSANIASQVEGGQTALKELLLQNISKFRVPSYLNAVASTGNKALNILEDKIGKETMRVLTEAMKTPEGARDLLESLPTAEHNRVLKLLSNPSKWKYGAGAVTGSVAAGKNMLSPDESIENSLTK